MSSSTMSSRLLDAADLLLREGRSSTAFRRRAVSTAYYALFHALAKVCADYVTRSTKRSDVDYQRVYRSLDHGPLKTAFSQQQLKENKKLSRIGTIVVMLQAERHRADYLPPVAGVFTRDRASELVDLARQAVNEVEAIRPNQKDCRILATNLLFRERKQ